MDLICPSYRSLLEEVYSGKLYVTNSVFSNGIGGLCVVILQVFFPSVKSFSDQEKTLFMIMWCTTRDSCRCFHHNPLVLA